MSMTSNFNLSGYLRWNKIIVALVFLMVSCSDDQVVNSTLPDSQKYFPLKQGAWMIYQVDSTGYQTSNCQEQAVLLSYQLKEVVDSSFIDGTNEEAFRIMRYKRANASMPWQFINVWTAKLKNNSAERVEDNIRFVKLSFPVDSKVTWDGNAYNQYDEELYRYGQINQPYDMNSLHFNETAEVVQYRLDDTLIFKINKTERYAKNIGMIDKIMDSTYNYINCGQFLDTVTGIIRFRRSGISFRQRLISYGN